MKIQYTPLLILKFDVLFKCSHEMNGGWKFGIKIFNSQIKSITESACNSVEKLIMEFIVITRHNNKIHFTISNNVFNKETLRTKVVDFKFPFR